ncbi:MAG: hypothetical protein ABI451_04920 [Dokdonella sp.]
MLESDRCVISNRIRIGQIVLSDLWQSPDNAAPGLRMTMTAAEMVTFLTNSTFWSLHRRIDAAVAISLPR